MHGAVPSASDLVDDEVRHQDLAKVAEMDRAGRAETGRADDRLAGSATLRLGDEVIRETIHPVDLDTISHDRIILSSYRSPLGLRPMFGRKEPRRPPYPRCIA